MRNRFAMGKCNNIKMLQLNNWSILKIEFTTLVSYEYEQIR